MIQVKTEELFDAIKESRMNVGVMSYEMMYNKRMPLRMVTLPDKTTNVSETATTIIHGGYPVAHLRWVGEELVALRIYFYTMDEGREGVTHKSFLTQLCTCLHENLGADWIPSERPYDKRDLSVGTEIEFTKH